MSFTYNFYGVSLKKEDWFDLFLPQNIPFLINPALCIIEISYSIRVAILAIRLFANILSGHILLHLLISYLLWCLFLLINFFYFIIILLFFLILLKWFMAFMQATIFVLLLSVWFNENIL
jgi:F0F1-type ATP synthase membrane subunit a